MSKVKVPDEVSEALNKFLDDFREKIIKQGGKGNPEVLNSDISLVSLFFNASLYGLEITIRKKA